jgi:pimeloyl-ACP methyl ester carboxylesterase
VYTYDRRGHGDSGDTAPYAVEREVEDLATLIAEAGGPAAVFGYLLRTQSAQIVHAPRRST